jgi:hypothetical protein
MVEMTYRVGDVVAWDDVQDGWLVRDADGDYALRIDGQGHYVATPNDIEGGGWESWEEMDSHHDAWPWNNSPSRSNTIIATGLSGKETAADMQQLAEVYEVREALKAWPMSYWAILLRGAINNTSVDVWAQRLHAAGWRPGDSAARAADLLAAEGRR